jgi:hypothetical protein
MTRARYLWQTPFLYGYGRMIHNKCMTSARSTNIEIEREFPFFYTSFEHIANKSNVIPSHLGSHSRMALLERPIKNMRLPNEGKAIVHERHQD